MEAGSSSKCKVKNKVGTLCDCGLEANILTSWTDKNPGRKFYGCSRYKGGGGEHCKYFKWFDTEEVMGWPKRALLEARDEIRRLNRVNGELRREVEDLKLDSLVNDIVSNLGLD